MEEVSRFKLTELVELSPSLSHYRGRLANGTQAEMFLIHQNATDQTEEKDCLLEFFRRIKLARLVSDRSILPILDFDEFGKPPFVALQGGSVSLGVLLDNRELMESQLQAIAVTCLSALAACADFGLSIDELSHNSIRWVGSSHWQIDASGLCSRFELAHGEFLSDFSEEVAERASELQSVAKLLTGIVQRHGLENCESVKRIDSALTPCLRNLQSNLPSARELLKILLGDGSQVVEKPLAEKPFDVGATASPSDDENELTMEIEPTIARSGFLSPGTQLGRYRVCERLGSGGMGNVYRAEDLIEPRSVAIKVLNKQVDQDSVLIKRFAKEAKLLARANNPYVANLYEVVSESEQPFMVVEFIDGGTLGSILKAGQPMDEAFVLALMIDAARGLAIAHSRGVVHRDIKPDNILLTSAATEWLTEIASKPKSVTATELPEIGKIYAKVSDFGLARTAQQSESLALTREGAIMGTPLYMSPEQCQGIAADSRTDVYSLGVTLFQLLSGAPPFQADSQVALMNLHCSSAPPSLKKLRPELSDALVNTVEKCLAKNPDARYANAGELLIDLENILRGEPTSLVLHPPILSLNDSDVIQFEHSWELKSGSHQLWPYISDTDRVNHAIGLPTVTYTVRQDPLQGTIRFAEAKIAGLLLRWREHPYEWIEGRRMSVLREFTHGPFFWFVNVVELTPTLGGGTLVNQKLIAKPRSWLGKQVAKIQLGKKSKLNFGRIYEQIDTFITRGEINKPERDPFVGRTEIRSGQKQRLYTRIEQLKQKHIDPRVTEAFQQYLENASDLEVSRIRPIAFAERFRFDPNQVINACLEGTRLGVFSLLWDIMCPSCRIPSNVQETLAAIKGHGYCDACNLDFRVDLAESVELIFRVHPEIRDVTTAIYCIGGPAWSKHVVAQIRLAAGERFACELSLSEGSYIVRGLQLPFTIDLRISHSGLIRRVELSMARPPASNRVTLALGSQVIHLCNDSAVDQQIRIERTAGRHDALSAARASTLALFRELFPGEVLSTDQMVSVAHITVMRVQICGTAEAYRTLGDNAGFEQVRSTLQKILECTKLHSGAVVKTVGEGFLACFPDSVNAVRAAMRLKDQAQSDPRMMKIAIAIHSGPAMVATLEERLDYFGSTLQLLEQLLQGSEAQSIRLTSAIAEIAEVQAVLQEVNAHLSLLPEVPLPDGTLALKVTGNSKSS
jgi:eukaryotic-like serine/threonine-protein kinase